MLFSHTLFDVISMVEKSTLFRRTLSNVILIVEKSTLFPCTLFNVISTVEKSSLFPRTFIGVILLVEKSTLFRCTFFYVISMVEICTLFLLTFFDVILMGKNSTSFLVSCASENIREGFSCVCNFKQLTIARLFSLKKFYNLHYCKKNCCNLVFWVFTEQLLYKIILGQLHCYEVTLVKNVINHCYKKVKQRFSTKKRLIESLLKVSEKNNSYVSIINQLMSKLLILSKISSAVLNMPGIFTFHISQTT